MLELVPAREYTSIVLCCIIAIIGMQIHAMTNNTLWSCDLTAEMNVTEKSEHKVKVLVKIRTSLERKCWVVQQLGESSTGDVDVLFTKPVRKCQLLQAWYRLREQRKTTDDAITTIEQTESVFVPIRNSIIGSLVFIGFALVACVMDLFIHNPLFIVINMTAPFVSLICTLTSVIMIATKINYDAEFNQVDVVFFQSWILENSWGSSLTGTGRNFLKIFFERINKTDALRGKCSKGQPFLFLWITLIPISVAFLVSCYMYYVWHRGPSDSLCKNRDPDVSSSSPSQQQIKSIDSDDCNSGVRVGVHGSRRRRSVHSSEEDYTDSNNEDGVGGGNSIRDDGYGACNDRGNSSSHSGSDYPGANGHVGGGVYSGSSNGGVGSHHDSHDHHGDGGGYSGSSSGGGGSHHDSHHSGGGGGGTCGGDD